MMMMMVMMMMVMMMVVEKVKRPSWNCTGAACSLSSGQSSTVAGEPKFNAPIFFLSLIRPCQDIYCDQDIHAPHYPSKIVFQIWRPKNIVDIILNYSQSVVKINIETYFQKQNEWTFSLKGRRVGRGEERRCRARY